MKKLIDIRKLKAYMWVDSGLIVTDLKDTPHYQFLCGNKQPYTDYNKRYLPDHKANGFEELIDDFDLKKVGTIDCRWHQGTVDEYVIRDGFHRSCILLHKGREHIIIELKEGYETEEFIREELLKINDYRHNVRTGGLYGYHSFNIRGIDIPGQRNPQQRLNEIQKYYDFQGKQVLDLGCSVGGMLFHLTKIKGGIGVDNNLEVIQAAKNITKILSRDDLQFLQFDFENDLEDLRRQINHAPDIIFLLSVKGWIKNWRKLYDLARSYECPIVLETNNDQSSKDELQYFKQHGKEVKLIIDKSTDDITGNHRRKTYMI